MSGSWPPAGTIPLAIDIVSVQSQVVYGRVGNNVAMPILGALGFTVAAVPTVVLGNTPHYASMHGGAVPVEWFEGWLDDLAARGALEGLRAVLAGFLGSPAQAQALARWIRLRLAERPGLRVVIDPVIGDHDQGVYVDPGLVDAYRRELLPLADGLTPNDFELAHLTGRTLEGVEDTIAAARTLLAGRTQWVAVTSAAPCVGPRDRMRVVLVTRTDAHVITHSRVDSEPKGTGDLFAASLVGCWMCGDPLPGATARACRHVIAALRATAQMRCAELLLPNIPAERRDDDDVTVRAVRFDAGTSAADDRS